MKSQHWLCLTESADEQKRPFIFNPAQITRIWRSTSYVTMIETAPGSIRHVEESLADVMNMLSVRGIFFLNLTEHGDEEGGPYLINPAQINHIKENRATAITMIELTTNAIVFVEQSAADVMAEIDKNLEIDEM